MSHPTGRLVNDDIPEQLCIVKYMLFDQVIRSIWDGDPVVDMVKCDINSPFHLLPVVPRNSELLRFYFEGHCFSSFLEWTLIHQTRFGKVVHFLDNVMFMVPQRIDQCRSLLNAFMA